MHDILVEIAERASVRFDAADSSVVYVDQRLLPHERRYVRTRNCADVAEAIRSLAIRGAPAIGIAGAYAVVLAERAFDSAHESYLSLVGSLRAARPTAVNLAWAIDRVVAAPDALTEAYAIHAEQIESDRGIAKAALAVFGPQSRVLTHCHTGGIATAGEGTALGAIIAGYRAHRITHVYVDETRPLLQGSRLTMFELAEAGVPATLLVDSAAATLMQRGEIDCVMVGADRIAANFSTANKIGTYALAIAARFHQIPFYVAAPWSTYDRATPNGDAMIIEERAAEEVRNIGNVALADARGRVFNPAFDITPASLISAFITETGIERPNQVLA